MITTIAALLLCAHAWAAAKPQPTAPAEALPTDGKKVIALDSFKYFRIEMPGGEFHDFSESFRAGLTRSLLNSGLYLVVDAPPQTGNPSEVQIRSPEYYWPGTSTPVATISVDTEALSFQTGARGEKMLYGFDERTGPPDIAQNEFPLRLDGKTQPLSWFGDTFQSKGTKPFDSLSGLDLGDGFSLDVLFAWLSVKYARYHTEARFRVRFDLPLAQSVTQSIQVQGDGFFFDLAGAYENYSAQIILARRDALEQAIQKAMSASYEAIQSQLKNLPLMARIDSITADGALLLGTGKNANIRIGLVFQSVTHPELKIQITESLSSGSVGIIVRGDPSLATPGTLLKQFSSDLATTAADIPTRIDTYRLNENIPLSSRFSPPGLSRPEAFAKSLIEGVFLPYRIWRYFQYDRPHAKQPDPALKKAPNNSEWKTQIGLDTAPKMLTRPIVAIIDSGIDYNHPALHKNLWINPAPWKDPQGRIDTYGWDFISGDENPADDHYHGTQLASLVVQTAPNAKIIPLKAFNPWGITQSSALKAAFIYAVDHGANIILCGWKTPVRSAALAEGVEYARSRGIPIVTPVGNTESYPSAFTSDNILTVAAVGSQDEWFGLADDTPADIAAPGTNLTVAEPRGTYSKIKNPDWSSEAAAAITAGALARLIPPQFGTPLPETRAYPSLFGKILGNARPLTHLNPYVRGGLRLNISH